MKETPKPRRIHSGVVPDPISRPDYRQLARKLDEHLARQPRPVSLDDAHAPMSRQTELDVRRDYEDLVTQVRERNANRDALRSDHRVQAITEIAEHGAIRYLLSFLKEHRYDEKTRKIRRTIE